MTSFDQWNLLFLRQFFPIQATPKEVFIGATPSFLDEAGAELGGDDGFLQAVNQGPGWQTTGDAFVNRVKSLVKQRTDSRSRGRFYVDPKSLDESFRPPDGDLLKSAPTYLPYLALLARTAAVADSAGYYARLRNDLRLPNAWGSAQMANLSAAWTDLQKWTRALGDVRGRFVVRQLGNFSWIGIPKSQVIFRSGDDIALGEIFTNLSLQPNSAISKPDLEKVIAAIAAGGHGVSTGLAQAGGDIGYRAELGKLVEAFFNEWPGPIDPPTKATGTRSWDRRDTSNEQQPEDMHVGTAKFGLMLANGRLPWRIQIEIEADENADLAGIQGKWKLRHCSERALNALLPAEASKEFLSGKDWSLDLFGKAIRLERRPLWVLTPSVLSDGEAELWDEGLPLHGAVYLLAPKEHAPALASYLEQHAVRHQAVESLDGLPDGWCMVLVDRCQDLTDAQRNELPVRVARRQPIRFEGGTRLRIENEYRYLPYDLPEVVLAASLDASIECSGEPLIGLASPIVTSSASDLVSGSVRRYQLPESMESGGDYQIIAKDKQGKVIRQTTVKVAHYDATQTRGLDDLQTGLDCFGRPSSAPGAMRGGLPADQIWKFDRDIQAGCLLDHAGNFGKPLELNELVKDPCALFLDYLSKEGTLSFGRAKVALRRMSAKARGETRSPTLLLKDLFVRGHLELSRSEDGHVTYVHAAAPQAYFLPVKTRDQRNVLGVLGTMDIKQWAFLAQVSTPRLWTAVSKRETPGTVVHLLTGADHAPLSRALASASIGLLPSPSMAIAKWSANEAEARNSIVILGRDRTPNAMGVPRELDVEWLRFQRAEVGSQLGADGKYALSGNTLGLYEYEDRHISGFKKYLLASKKGFSPVQDSQWGVWIALGASGKGLRSIDRFYFDSDVKHELWLPKELRPPTVLERALVLCSGESPEEHYLSETETGDGIDLATPSGVYIATIGKDALSHPSKRIWLRYKRVPRHVVKAIQGKGS